jgi:hypothetical protein
LGYTKKTKGRKTGRKKLYRGLSFHPSLFFFIKAKTLIISRHWPHAASCAVGFWDLKDKERQGRNAFHL